jgi:hypothetical protein
MMSGLALNPFFMMGLALTPGLFGALALTPCLTMGLALIPFIVMGLALTLLQNLVSCLYFNNNKKQNYRGDLCCAFECHDVDGVLSYNRCVSSGSPEEGYYRIYSRLLKILPFPA